MFTFSGYNLGQLVGKIWALFLILMLERAEVGSLPGVLLPFCGGSSFLCVLQTFEIALL